MRMLMNNASRWLAILAVAVGGLSLTGCKTTEGAGKDIEKAGEKIQDAAD